MSRASIATSSLSSVNTNKADILNILKSIDANKAHGHDDISTRMLKLSHKSILKSLILLFENCLGTGIFLDQWKKADIAPIHKKDDKQLFKNTDQIPCPQFREKCLSVSFLMTYLNTSKKT